MVTHSGYQYCSVTHQGLVRETNEDCVGLSFAAGAVLAVVADGMGGHDAGEIASRTCMESLRRTFLDGEDAPPEVTLREGLVRAHENILRQSSEDGKRGMGTTVVAAIVKGGECWYSHVGDSRLYLLSSGRLERLTRDHTVAQDLLDQGLITEGQADSHHMSHIVSKALGHLGPADAGIPVKKTTLQEESTLLLCSDGLTDLVSDEEIRRAIHGRQPQEACNDLLELVLTRGAHDNVSILLCKWTK